MWDTFYGSNFIINPEKEHGVSMFVPQSPLPIHSFICYLANL